jgi:hypothetical protein
MGSTMPSITIEFSKSLFITENVEIFSEFFRLHEEILKIKTAIRIIFFLFKDFTIFRKNTNITIFAFSEQE